MIDSTETEKLCEAIKEFRGYVISQYDPRGRTAHDYLQKAANLSVLPKTAIILMMQLCVNITCPQQALHHFNHLRKKQKNDTHESYL